MAAIHIYQRQKVVWNIFGFYRSPNLISDSEFLTFFDEWCEQKIELSDMNIICGDFNIDLLTPDLYCESMKRIIKSTGIKEIVN